MSSTTTFSKGRKLDFDALSALKNGSLLLPRIPRPPSASRVQSARGIAKATLDLDKGDRDAILVPQTVRVVRKDGLDRLEERWRSRQAPKHRVVKDCNSSGLPDGRKAEDLSETLRSSPPSDRARSPGAESPQDLEQDAEMAELRALMAANDVEAAENKLQRIIDAAEEDGHIDEDEQRQIDAAKLELAAMRKRQEEERRAYEIASAKAAEQAALQSMLLSNDVVAAERKLREIIAAAEEDGHIDEEEQRQIDEARRELEKLQVKSMYSQFHLFNFHTTHLSNFKDIRRASFF
jgi:hypothetical protein